MSGPPRRRAGGAVAPGVPEASLRGPRPSRFRFRSIHLYQKNMVGHPGGAPACTGSGANLARLRPLLALPRPSAGSFVTADKLLNQTVIQHETQSADPLQQRHRGRPAAAARLLGRRRRRQHSVEHRAVHQQRLGAALHGHSHQLVQQLHRCRAGGCARHQALELRVGGWWEGRNNLETRSGVAAPQSGTAQERLRPGMRAAAKVVRQQGVQRDKHG